LNRGAGGILAAIWILSTGAAAHAATGTRSPLTQRLPHDGQDLFLQSVSLREATFLKVNVYWVGLYAEAVSTPADSILHSDQTKAFVFHFLRDVKSAKLGDAWIQDLTESCESGCGSVIAQGRVLAKRMPDIHCSQKIAYILFPDRVEILIDGVSLGTLNGADASQAVLATFLGPKAPEELRRDLVPSCFPAPR